MRQLEPLELEALREELINKLKSYWELEGGSPAYGDVLEVIESWLESNDLEVVKREGEPETVCLVK